MKKLNYFLLVLTFTLLACSSNSDDNNNDLNDLSSEQVISKLQGRWKSNKQDKTWYYQFINENEGYRFNIADELESLNELLIQPFDFNYNPDLKLINLNIWSNGRNTDGNSNTQNPIKLDLDLNSISKDYLEVNNQKWERLNIGVYSSILGTWTEITDPADSDPEVTTLILKTNDKGEEIVTWQNTSSEHQIEYIYNEKQGLFSYKRFYDTNDFEEDFYIILELNKGKLKFLSNEGIIEYKR